MKNRLKHLFENKNRRVLSIFLTAGFPQLDSTPELIQALENSGADLIEVGIPFSDPLADGETIQASSQKALENGMNLKLLLEQIASISSKVDIPLILMGYLNPIIQYGELEFLEKCHEIGVAGLIIPDLPVEYFRRKWQRTCEKLALPAVFLITPQTSESRIREIDDLSQGFIYMVSTNSLTGQNKSILEQGEYFKRIHKMNLKNPLLVGFGIHNRKTCEFAFEHANGAIIGSAYIRSLSKGGDLTQITQQFISSLS